MSRAETLYLSPSNLNRKQIVRLWKDSAFLAAANLKAVADARDTTVSEITWTTGDSTVITIEDAAITANVAEVEVTAEESGSADLKCKATFADGTVAVAWWDITVKDVG